MAQSSTKLLKLYIYVHTIYLKLIVKETLTLKNSIFINLLGPEIQGKQKLGVNTSQDTHAHHHINYSTKTAASLFNIHNRECQQTLEQ